MKTVSFLASGRGSNFEACLKKIESGYIPAHKGVLITDKEKAGALTIAENSGMQNFFINPKDFQSREDHEKEIYRVLKEAKTDLIVLAGYMRIITPYLIGKYKHRIINIHPALLPSFQGIRSQKQALDYGAKVTGCTAHFIDSGVDTGPIILQKTLDIFQDDTETSLSSRIIKEEHSVLPEAIKLFCEGRLKVTGRKVFILKG